MSALSDKVRELKKKKNAVILAHNYQIAEVQDIADYVGDSLGLSLEAAKTSAELIIFCGVHFMAETAAIICPDKTVLMPEVNAGCPMANMITAEKVRQLKKEHPRAKVVCYVNTTAAVKAESDICCTSANSVAVVRSIPEEEIIFIPDKYLGQYTARFVRKKFIFSDGYCPTHVLILPEEVQKAKGEHPQAKVLVHPECTPAVIDLADKALSTGGMIKYAKESDAQEIIVGTEVGLLHRLQKENPSKKFYPVTTRAICPNMKFTTLEKVLWSLEAMKVRITVDKNIADRARRVIQRMLQLKATRP